MSNRIHALAQQLTGKSSVEECSLEEVQHIVKRYPYFAPAQFLLAQKLKENKSPDLKVQQAKAILFFPDPLLFNAFIFSDKFYSDEVANKDEIVLSPDMDQQQKPVLDAADGEENEGPVVMDFHTEIDSVSKEAGVDSENKNLLVVDIKSDKNNIDGVKELTQPSSHKREAFGKEVIIDNSNESFVSDIAPADSKSETPNTTSAEKSTSPPIQKEELAFEPYHTVDYFASQGIKVSQDGLLNDRLGKQLKSFTDWLKTMKKLPATHVIEKVEIIAEKKVENMASRSVSESTIITEAMAEVWAKQGNLEKAAETYNKLSLLNPAKKAFFAAKIENLKTV